MPSPLLPPLHAPLPVRQAVLEAFEPRILYAADAAALAWAAGGGLAGGVGVQSVQQSWALTQDLQAGAGTESAAGSVRELVVVDLSLPDAQVLLAGLQAQRDAGRPIEIVTLQAQDDGIAVIGDALDQHQGLTALHLLTHGGPGHVQLGAVRLDATTLSWQAAEIARWSSAFAPGADWLIYGCDVAQGGAGQNFVQQLALLSGADVAASDDSTGAFSAGGDWVLEQQTGAVQAALAADAPLQQAWQGLMQASPLSTQFTVNQVADKNQNTLSLRQGSQNAVARDVQGNFVVVWTSDGQDGSDRGVFARRFDHAGNALSNDIQVNATTKGNQQHARVAMADDGRFVVTWTSTNQDGSGEGVYAAVFQANGNVLVTDILVNSTVAGDQRNPVVGINRSTGEFVVAWEGNGTGDSSGVFARRFGANGVAEDAEQRVNGAGATAGDQRSPAVVMNLDGSHVVAWESGTDIHFQRFDGAGTAQGGAVLVDSSSLAYVAPALAADDQGNFTVAFMGDTTNPGVFFRRYLADGRAAGAITALSNASTASHVAVAAAADGSRLVTWRERNSNTQGRDILAQAIRADGSLNGAMFVVNTSTGGEQQAPSAAMWDANHYVVVWSGRGEEVSARVYAEPPAAPRVVLPAGQTVYRVTVNENQTAVATLTASDANLPAQSLTWAVLAGGDGAEFEFAPNSSVLRFRWAPNAEAPLDADEDRVYEFTVRVTDSSGRSSDQAVAVTVVSVADEPVAVDKYVSVAPNGMVTISPMALDTLRNNDGDLRMLDYRLSSSANSVIAGQGTVTEVAEDADDEQLRYVAPAGALLPPDRIQYILDDGEQNVVSYWRLNGGTGTLALDVLGVGDGELHNSPQQVTGAFGTGYQFGGNTRLELPFTDDNGGYTLGFWFKLDNLALGANQVILQQSSPGGALLEVRVRQQAGAAQSGARELVTTMRANGGTVPERSIITPVTGAGRGGWFQYSVAVSLNQTTTVFLDGELSDRMDGVGTAASDLQAQPFWFGGSKEMTASAESFTGAIDAVGLVGHPLVPNETDGRVFGTYLDVGETFLGNAPLSVLTARINSYTLNEDTSLRAETMDNSWFAPAWSYRQRIDFANNGPGLQNTPVRLTLDTRALTANGMDVTGKDLRFADPNNPQTALAHYVESWNVDGTSVVWVKAPSIANGSSSSIHVYYGNPLASDTQSAGDVWGPDAAVVLHMGDTLASPLNPAGHRVTQNGAALQADGVAGAARDFNGSESDIAIVSAGAPGGPPVSPSDLNNVFAGGGAVSVWIRPDTAGEEGFGTIADKAGDEQASLGWNLQVTADNRLRFSHGFGGVERSWSTAPNSIRRDAWAHVAVVFDSDNPLAGPKFYINGVDNSVPTIISGLGLPASDAAYALHVGNHSQEPSRTFFGLIDEFRLWRNTRELADIAAEYHSTASVTSTLRADIERPGLAANASASGTLIAVKLSNPSHGVIEWPSSAADGRFSYVPRANFSGTDTFTYALTNGSSISEPVTVTLTVQPQPDAPVITRPVAAGQEWVIPHAENSLHVTRLTATDPDNVGGSGATLRWSIRNSSEHPEWPQFVIDERTGDLSFVALPDFEDPQDSEGGDNIYGIRVRVTDEADRVDDVDLSIRIMDVVEQPIARTDTGTTAFRNMPADLAVLANDVSQQDTPLKLLDARGASVDDANNRLAYTPGADASGDVSLAYLLTDSEQGLQHYWRLDGNAQDVMGSAHGSPLGNPGVVTNGAWGQAMGFDGIDDAIRLPDLNYASNFTLSMWFKVPSNAGTQAQTLFSHGTRGEPNSLNIHLREATHPLGPNQLRTRLVDANDTTGVDRSVSLDASDFIDNQWHLYTLVVQQGQAPSVYVDGVRRVTGTENTGAFNPGGDAVLGSSTNLTEADRYLNGGLDGVNLFSRALSDAEVMAQYTGGTALGNVTVSVSEQVNVPPEITSNARADEVTLTLNENTTRVMDLRATDNNVPAQTLTWSLSGPDAARFRINEADNSLHLVQAQDFEDPAGSPIWEVVVTVSDGQYSDTQRIKVVPRNVDEGDVGELRSATGETRSVTETADVGSAVGLTVVASDPDGGVTYSLLNNAGGRFAINSTTGVVTLAQSLLGGTETHFDITVKAASTGSSNQGVFRIGVDRTPPTGNADSFAVNEDANLASSVMGANWWNSAWQYRQQVTVAGNNTTLPTNTPLRVTLNARDLLANGAAANGRDLRFVTADGRAISHVVESWSATGNAVVWVNVPPASVAPAANHFFVYYGNAAATDTQAPAGVWGANALLVLDTGTGNGTDLAGSGSQITLEGAPPLGSNVPSRLGTARLFTESDDRVVIDPPANSRLDNFFVGGGTLIAWVNPQQNALIGNGSGRIAARANGLDPTVGWDFSIQNRRLSLEIGLGGQRWQWTTGPTGMDAGTWYQVAVTFDAGDPDATPIIYLDGAQMALDRPNVTTNGVTRSPRDYANDSGLLMNVGNHPNTNGQARQLWGQVDDVRIYDGILSSTVIESLGNLGNGPAVSLGLRQRQGVLGNDVRVNGRGPLTAVLGQGPSHASAFTLSDDGTFSYRPEANFFGTDSFTYRVDDGVAQSEPVTVILNVVGQPDAPVITDGGQSVVSIDVPENQATVGALQVVDPDALWGGSETLTWTILSANPVTGSNLSVDHAAFLIDPFTGALSFERAKDFESRESVNENNTFEIVVRVTDSTNRADTQYVRVNVTNVIEPPQANPDTVTANYNEAVTIDVLQEGNLAAPGRDVSRDGRSLRVLDVEDGELLNDDRVTYTPTPDQSGVTDTFRYRISDGSEGLTYYWRMDETVVSAIGSAEGQSSAVTDTEGAFGRALSFNGSSSEVVLPSLDYNANGWTFSFWFKLDDLDGAGVRTFFDHGTESVNNGRADRLSVMAYGSGHAEADLRNQLRTRLMMGATEVELEIPLVTQSGTLLGGWHAYTLTASSTAGVRVYIDETQVVESSTAVANFAPQGSAYFGRSTSDDTPDRLRGAMDTVASWNRALSADDVRVWVPANANDTVDSTVSTVTVNIGARPPEAPRITSSASVETPENLRDIVQVTAEDRDLSTPRSEMRFSIVGGAHAGLFSIDAVSGQLSWGAAPDYENAPPSAMARTYVVTVRVTDDSRHDEQTMVVKLQDANEFGVAFVPAESGDQDPSENVVPQAAATGIAAGVRMLAVDRDGTTNSVRYSLSNDAGGRFMIEPFTGVIRVQAPIGNDPPAEYVLRVVASSADDSVAEIPVTIRVEPTPNLPPRLPELARLNIPENNWDVTVVQATDDGERQPLRYSLHGGPDMALFELNASTGQLRLISPADRERALDANDDNVYQVTVAAYDGEHTVLQSIELRIDNVEEAPTWAVNQMTITNGQVQLQIRADDVDTPADRLSYTVSEASGGWFAPSGSPSTRLGSFTQAQVLSGEVVFRLDGSGRTPGFTLSMSDGTSQPKLQEAAVTVIGSIPMASVAPAPAPSAPAPSAPPPRPAPAPAAESPASPPAPERSTTPTLARMASNAAEATDEAQGDKQSDAEREGVAGLDALLEGRASREAAERAVGRRALSALMSGGPSAAGAFSSAAALAVRALDLADAMGLDGAWRGPIITGADSSSGLRSGYSDTAEARTYSALMQAMNRVREDVTGEELEVAVTVGSTALLSGSLSVGYVLWLLRGGVLMATVVSSVPAWAGIDPLPVLRQGRGADDEDRDEQDAERDADPLERLFSKARKMLHKDAAAASGAPSTRAATQADDKTLEVSP
ncbi:MAG: DUF2341 domain-containing protein [Rubrivivax sp.]|jgi:hypothetical protein|nr:DUF2341 domain-containing protein [Rubrivivax sp.]